MTLKATPIIKDKFWIIEDENNRIGSIYHEKNNKFIVTRNKKITEVFEDIESIKNKFGNNFFVSIKDQYPNKIECEVYGYPTDSTPYNSTYDIKRKLALFTKSGDSKSIYCAGYFAIKVCDLWETVFCPKLISIQRHENFGPFKTKKEAEEKLCYEFR
jgi:hypothetical protein